MKLTIKNPDAVNISLDTLKGKMGIYAEDYLLFYICADGTITTPKEHMWYNELQELGFQFEGTSLKIVKV